MTTPKIPGGFLVEALHEPTPHRRTGGFLSIALVAHRLGVDASSARRLARAGAFPHARRTSLGRNAHWLVPPADVDDFFRRTGVAFEQDEQLGQDGPTACSGRG